MKVYIVDAGGGPPRAIVPDDIEQGIPSWAPDSRHLTFGDVPETFGVPDGTETIHIYDLDTRQTTTIPGSRGLWTSRWSSDSRYIAALTIRDQRLMLYDSRDGIWRDLRAGSVGDLMWARDGRSIVIDPEKFGPEYAIRRVRVPDGSTEDLTARGEQSPRRYRLSGIGLEESPLILRLPVVRIYALELDRRAANR